MHSCIFYHWSTRPRTVYIFVLRLSARPFTGLVDKAASNPVKFTFVFWYGWHLPIGLFCFTRCIPTHWVFSWAGFSAVSYILSVLEGPLISQRLGNFWRGFRSCQIFFSNRSHTIWIVCPVRYPWGSLLLSPGCRLSDRLSRGFSPGSCSSLSSRFSWGVSKFLRRTVLLL